MEKEKKIREGEEALSEMKTFRGLFIDSHKDIYGIAYS